MNTTVLYLDNIKKTYDGKRFVLDGLNLTVGGGEIITIQGESGSGKSTLLNIVGLLDDFNSGEYNLCGTNVSLGNAREKALLRSNKIGFVFQSYGLLDSLTVRDNIIMPFLYNHMDLDKSVFNMLEYYAKKLNLTDVLNKKAKYLSGGEKQRVAIIRAMLKKPSLILADEPTGNLDEQNAKLINQVFLDYLTPDTAAIIVTHNPHIFSDVSYSYALNAGRLTLL